MMRLCIFLNLFGGAVTVLLAATVPTKEVTVHRVDQWPMRTDAVPDTAGRYPPSFERGGTSLAVPVSGGDRERAPSLLWPDFQVNENVGRCLHWSPAVDLGPNGECVAVWRDNRNGYISVVFQRYDAQGNPQGPNIVSEETWANDPRVAVDGSGAFVLVWVEIRVYGQLFDANGNPISASFVVSDGSGSLPCDYPNIGMDSTGNFVVAWEDCREGYGESDIYARRFNASGQPLGGSFIVNDDNGTGDQHEPSISMNAGGSFAVTWVDGRGDSYSSIYAQLYDSSGDPIGPNFPVGDGPGNTWQREPSIGLDASGTFVVAWVDNRNGNDDIFAQRFDSLCAPLGSNFLVNHEPTSSMQLEPSVSPQPAGRFVIIWRDGRNDDHDVFAQLYDSSGEELGGNFAVNDDSVSAIQLWPCLTTDSFGNFWVLWQDQRHGNADIYGQRYDSSGNALGANLLVNDDVGSSHQTEPSIAMDPSGDFAVVWKDCRSGNNDIYAQRFHFTGDACGFNFMVNDDTGTATQAYPSIGMSLSGDFAIAWMDGRNGAFRIWAQRYDASGYLLGSNFQVSENTNYASQYDPDLGMDPSGDFVVAWRDYRWFDADIFAQRYDASGSPVGGNFKINDDDGSMAQSDPSVAMDSAGDFVVAWKDERNGYDSDIYAQRYDASCSPVGLNFRVNDFVPTSDQTFPSVSMDSFGGFVVAWEDNRYYPTRIRARRFDSSGNPIGGSFAVSDGMGTTSSRCSVSMEPSGGFMVTWADDRGDPYDIYAQHFLFDGSPDGGNWRVNTDFTPSDRGDPVVAYDGYRAVFAWHDTKVPGQGYDIWANGWELFHWDFYGEVAGGSLVLRWSAAPRADFIYVFRGEVAHFVPDVDGFANRVAVLPGDADVYSDDFGIGDPETHAFYRIMAWSIAAEELSRSDVVGECDFAISEGE